MIWILVIGTILFIIIRFIIAYSKQSESISNEGGMRKKYSEIIRYFLALAPKMRIVKETKTYILIESDTTVSKMSASIHHVFDEVVIDWHNSTFNMLPKKLKWNFNVNDSQQQMLDQITHDINIVARSIEKNMNSVMPDNVRKKKLNSLEKKD